jgi:hypothetical protein
MIFVGATVFMIGLLAIVVDVTWYWAKTLQVQRAADAAALAGAVWLPEQPTTATSTALASAKQNGFAPGSGVTVTAVQDPDRDIQLNTMVSAPVQTFFMRLFGMNSLQATRTAKAEYVLPVPMGSPLNYFGAFGDLRGSIHVDPGFKFATATTTPTGGWTNVANATLGTDGVYAVTTNQLPQGFRTFNIPMYGTSQTFGAGGGIEIKVVGKASVAAGCKIKVDVSYNGTNWFGGSAAPYSKGQSGSPGASQTLGTTDTTLIFGGEQSTSATDTDDWFGATNWTASRLSNTNFRVRITPVGSPCIDSFDSVSVKVTYTAQTPRVVGPNGESLVKQGVWAGILSQGATVGNGDAYATQKNGSGNSTQYDPVNYYDYAIEMQPGTNGGSIYVYDPVFCATESDFSKGMGDHGYGGSMSTSTFYDVWDTNNTPYSTADDVWIAGNTGPTGSSNPQYGLFRNQNLHDPSQGGTSSGGSTSCELGLTTNPANGAYWHNRWWPLATGLAGPADLTPRIYRIHVVSTDPAAPGDQASVNSLNNFSLFASVDGHTCPSTPVDPLCPKVYGLGNMVAFSPLNPSENADLYLAEIGAAYAGKTIKVSLWDPGDTRPLRADLSFLMPTATGYQTASFTWTATRFAASGANCNGNGSGTSIRTNNGDTTGLFNGCWLVISIPIPDSYAAPTPPGEPGPGWWKIRYSMGIGSSNASDLTTWKTQLVGNPVHLIVP